MSKTPNETVVKLGESFEKYLKGLKYSPKTIARYLAWEKEFSTCFSKENNHKLLNYNDLLSYFIEKESRGLTRSTLVHLLARIKCYYGYLGVENPLEDFKLKGYTTKKRSNYLSTQNLSSIAVSYHKNTRLSNWSKIALGLLVYQGVSTHELPNIRIGDLNLERGELSIKSSSLAARILKLEANQILSLLTFTNGKSLKNKLLPNLCCKDIENRYSHLKEQIKRELRREKQAIPFDNLQQLRRSRIHHWINEQGILAAQYLAGHKSLISTQSYQKEEGEELRAIFKALHPLF